MSPPSSDGLAPFLRCRRPGLSPAPPLKLLNPPHLGDSSPAVPPLKPLGVPPWVFRWFVFVDFPTFSNTARSSSRRAANRIEKDLIAFCFPLRLTLAARAGRRRLGSTYRMRAADEMNQRRLRPLKPEGFVLAVLLSWQRLHRPRMRAGSFGSSPASTSSTRSSGQWSAMVLGAPHRPWCLPHPSCPSPGQTHRGSLASTRARASLWAGEVYGLRPRERRLSLAFLHSSHREPEETRCGQPEVEHTLYIAIPHRQRGV